MPGLTFPTNDTTIFAFKGTTYKSDNWYLMTALGSTNNNSAHSTYSNGFGGTDHMNELRVRLTFIMYAGSSLAALFITVTGLTERELPVSTCPSGITYLSIEGLCSSEGQDLRHNTVRYAAFVRNNSAAEDGKVEEVRYFE